MFARLFVTVGVLLLPAAGVAHAQSNYPLQATLELRDAQDGSIEDGVCVGAEIRVRANGWQAGAALRAQYFSDPVELGTFKAGNDGAVAFSFNVPDAPPVPGTHTFRLSGVGANGQPRTVEAAIRCLGNCDQPGAAVAGKAVADTGRGSSSNFAKTGAFLGQWFFVGFALVATGVALIIAVRQNRAMAVAPTGKPKRFFR